AQIQLSASQLVESSLRRGEGKLTESGALRAETGKYTGRSPKDRFIVEDDVSGTEWTGGRSTSRFQKRCSTPCTGKSLIILIRKTKSSSSMAMPVRMRKQG